MTKLQQHADATPEALPVPDGAEADIWDGGYDSQPYRVLHGVTRGLLPDRDDVLIGITAIQLPDGRVDDGTITEPPHVYIETNQDAGLTTVQARQFAQLVIDAADELDGWVTR